MSEKQDRQGARTAADLERKYQFGKRFAEVMGVALDAQNAITVVDSELRLQIAEQYTKITRDTEAIILEALTKYVQTSDYDEFQRTVSTQFKVMADEISANLQSATEWYTEVSEELDAVNQDLQGTKGSLSGVEQDITNLGNSLDEYSTASEAFKQTVTEELTNAVNRISAAEGNITETDGKLEEVGNDLDSVKDDLVLHYQTNAEFKEYCENELSATANQIKLNMESTTESFTEVNATLETAKGDILEEHKFTEELKKYCESEFAASSENLNLKFESATEQITTVNGDVQKISEELQKNFEFSANGLTIKAGENKMRLRIDNNMIAFYSGEIDESDLTKNRLGWWDGDDFHTGNITVAVNERAQFGNFSFIPRSNGSLDFLKVGG